MAVERKWSTTTEIIDGQAVEKQISEWTVSDPELDRSYVAIQPGNYPAKTDLTPYKGINLTEAQLEDYQLPVPLGIGEENAVVHVYPQGTIEIHGRVYAWNKLVKPGIYSRYEKLRYLDNAVIPKRETINDYRHHAAYNRTIRVPNHWVKKRTDKAESILEYTYVEWSKQMTTKNGEKQYPIPVLNGRLTLYPDGTFKTEGVVVDSQTAERIDKYGYLGDQVNYRNGVLYFDELTKDDINPLNVYQLLSENEDGSVTYGAIESNQHLKPFSFPKLPRGLIPVNDGKVFVSPLGELTIEGLVITDKGYRVLNGFYESINDILIGWKRDGSYDTEHPDYVDKSQVYNPYVDLRVIVPGVSIQDPVNPQILMVIDPDNVTSTYEYHYHNDTYDVYPLEDGSYRSEYRAMKGWGSFVITPTLSETEKQKQDYKRVLLDYDPVIQAQCQVNYLDITKYPIKVYSTFQIGSKYRYRYHRYNPDGALDFYSTLDHQDIHHAEGLTLSGRNTHPQRIENGVPVYQYQDFNRIHGPYPWNDEISNTAPVQRLTHPEGKPFKFIPFQIGLPKNREGEGLVNGQVYFEEVNGKLFVNIEPPVMLVYGDRYLTLEKGRVELTNIDHIALSALIGDAKRYLDEGPIFIRNKQTTGYWYQDEKGYRRWVFDKTPQDIVDGGKVENLQQDQDGLTYTSDKGLLSVLRRDVTHYLTDYEKALFDNCPDMVQYSEQDPKTFKYHRKETIRLDTVFDGLNTAIHLMYYGFRFNEVFPSSRNVLDLWFRYSRPNTQSLKPYCFYHRDQAYWWTYQEWKAIVGDGKHRTFLTQPGNRTRKYDKVYKGEYTPRYQPDQNFPLTSQSLQFSQRFPISLNVLGGEAILSYWGSDRPNGKWLLEVEKPFWNLSTQKVNPLRFSEMLPEPNGFNIYYRLSHDLNFYSGTVGRNRINKTADSNKYYQHEENPTRQLVAEDILAQLPEGRRKGYMDIFLDNPFDEDMGEINNDRALPENLEDEIEVRKGGFWQRVYYRTDNDMREITFIDPEVVDNFTSTVEVSAEGPSEWYLMNITLNPEVLMSRGERQIPYQYLLKGFVPENGLFQFDLSQLDMPLVVGHTYRLRVVDVWGITRYKDFTIEKRKVKFGDFLTPQQLFGTDDYLYPMHARPNFDNKIREHSIEASLSFDVENQRYLLEGIWMDEQGRVYDEGWYDIGHLPTRYRSGKFTKNLFDTWRNNILPVATKGDKIGYIVKRKETIRYEQVIKPDDLYAPDIHIGSNSAYTEHWLLPYSWRVELESQGIASSWLAEGMLPAEIPSLKQGLLQLGKNKTHYIRTIQGPNAGRHQNKLVVGPFFEFVVNGQQHYGYQGKQDVFHAEEYRLGVTLEQFIRLLKGDTPWVAGANHLTSAFPNSPAAIGYRYIEGEEALTYQVLSPRLKIGTIANMTVDNKYLWYTDKIYYFDKFHGKQQITPVNDLTFYQLKNWFEPVEAEDYQGEPNVVYFFEDYSYTLNRNYTQIDNLDDKMRKNVYNRWQSRGLGPEQFEFNTHTLGRVIYHQDGKTITVEGRVKVNGKYTPSVNQTVTGLSQLTYLDIDPDVFTTLYDTIPNRRARFAFNSDEVEIDDTMFFDTSDHPEWGYPVRPTLKDFHGELIKVEISANINETQQAVSSLQDLVITFTVNHLRREEVEEVVIFLGRRNVLDYPDEVNRYWLRDLFYYETVKQNSFGLKGKGGKDSTGYLKIVEPWRATSTIEGESVGQVVYQLEAVNAYDIISNRHSIPRTGTYTRTTSRDGRKPTYAEYDDITYDFYQTAKYTTVYNLGHKPDSQRRSLYGSDDGVYYPHPPIVVTEQRRVKSHVSPFYRHQDKNAISS